MSDALHQESHHRRPHAQVLAGSFLEFDLARELHQLRHEPEWETGQNARTLAKYENFGVVLTALRPPMRIPGHQTEGRISIHTILGHLKMRALGRTFDLPTGTLLTLDHGIVHDVEALEESALLLTIAWPGRGQQQGLAGVDG